MSAEVKACGCYVGFCRAETLLDALTEAVMVSNVVVVGQLQRAYDEQAAKCVGGFRATPPRYEEDEQ